MVDVDVDDCRFFSEGLDVSGWLRGSYNLDESPEATAHPLVSDVLSPTDIVDVIAASAAAPSFKTVRRSKEPRDSRQAKCLVHSPRPVAKLRRLNAAPRGVRGEHRRDMRKSTCRVTRASGPWPRSFRPAPGYNPTATVEAGSWRPVRGQQPYPPGTGARALPGAPARRRGAILCAVPVAHHLARALEFVIHRLDSDLDFFLHAGKILFSLGQLSFALCNRRAPESHNRVGEP